MVLDPCNGLLSEQIYKLNFEHTLFDKGFLQFGNIYFAANTTQSTQIKEKSGITNMALQMMVFHSMQASLLSIVSLCQ